MNLPFLLRDSIPGMLSCNRWTGNPDLGKFFVEKARILSIIAKITNFLAYPLPILTHPIILDRICAILLMYNDIFKMSMIFPTNSYKWSFRIRIPIPTTDLTGQTAMFCVLAQLFPKHYEGIPCTYLSLKHFIKTSSTDVLHWKL